MTKQDRETLNNTTEPFPRNGGGLRSTAAVIWSGRLSEGHWWCVCVPLHHKLVPKCALACTQMRKCIRAKLTQRCAGALFGGMPRERVYLRSSVMPVAGGEVANPPLAESQYHPGETQQCLRSGAGAQHACAQIDWCAHRQILTLVLAMLQAWLLDESVWHTKLLQARRDVSLQLDERKLGCVCNVPLCTLDRVSAKRDSRWTCKIPYITVHRQQLLSPLQAERSKVWESSTRFQDATFPFHGMFESVIIFVIHFNSQLTFVQRTRWLSSKEAWCHGQLVHTCFEPM